MTCLKRESVCLCAIGLRVPKKLDLGNGFVMRDPNELARSVNKIQR